MVDATAQDLSLRYRDENSYRRFDDAGKVVDSPLNRYLATVKTQLHDQGIPDTDPAFLKGMQTALGSAYVDRIKQLAVENPKAAYDFMNRADVLPVIPVEDREKLGHQLKTITDAYNVDGLMQQVTEKLKSVDPDKEIDPDEAYEEVKKLTTDPHQRELAYKEITRTVGLRNKGIKERFDRLSGGLLLDAHKDWDAKRETSVVAMRKDPRFLALPQNEQVTVLNKVEAENWKIHEHSQKMASEKRTRQTQASREQQRMLREEWDANYNHYQTNPEELAQMSKDEFEGLAGRVSHADYKKLAEQRKKLTGSTALSHAVVESEMLNGLLQKAGITEAGDVKKYGDMARHYVNAAQKEAKHVLSPEEKKAAIIQGLQHVSVSVKTSRLGFNTGYEVEDKRRMEVKNPAAIVIPPETHAKFDALERRRGKPLSPERRQLLYDEILKEKAAEEAR